MKRFSQYCLSMFVGCGILVGLALVLGGISRAVDESTGSSALTELAALVISSLASTAIMGTIFHTSLGDRFAHWLTTTEPFRRRSLT